MHVGGKNNMLRFRVDQREEEVSMVWMTLDIQGWITSLKKHLFFIKS